MPDNWTTVGDAITGRMDELGMEQKELATSSGVSVATIREIQGGKARRRNPRILRDISRALGWHPSHLASMLKGQQSDLQSQSTQPPDDRPPAFGTKLAFILEHRLGEVVDVIYNSQSDVDITIEIRHSPREPSTS